MYKVVALVLWLSTTFVAAVEKVDFYLLIGQSNMAGRAKITQDVAGELSNCYLLNDKGDWEAAKNPLNRYSTIRKSLKMQKLGPGYMFAKTMAESSSVPVGLVVNAKGGSSINLWTKGGKFFADAVSRTRAAQAKGGTLRGILWHQGESDSDDTDYVNKLVALIKDLRTELGDDELPFIAGQIRSSMTEFNERILALPNLVPHTAVVTTQGLTLLDKAHFDNASQLKLGERYAEKMKSMIK